MAKKSGEEIINEDLQGKIQDLQDKIEELTNNWKRALADYQNLERRYEKDKADFVAFANANLILRLVGVLGHLEKAAKNLNDTGLNLIVTEFKRVLCEEGLEEIETEGKKFDPNTMEAIDTVFGKEDGKVAEVINKGYLLKGKLLLAAKVKVFKAEKPEEKVEDLAKKEVLK